jgi:hypothetical protein
MYPGVGSEVNQPYWNSKAVLLQKKSYYAKNLVPNQHIKFSQLESSGFPVTLWLG